MTNTTTNDNERPAQNHHVAALQWAIHGFGGSRPRQHLLVVPHDAPTRVDEDGATYVATWVKVDPDLITEHHAWKEGLQ